MDTVEKTHTTTKYALKQKHLATNTRNSTMPTYTFKVLHDKGTHFVSIYAESGETALKWVCEKEGCPVRALRLVKIDRTFRTHKTAYQLKCGKVQVARTERKPGESDVVIKLWHSSGIYHVSIVKESALNVLWGEDEGKQWQYYSTLKEARKTFNAFIKLAETF